MIATISRLKYGMARDRALEYVVSFLPIYSRRMPESRSRRPIPADGEAPVDEYNAELARLEERGQNTWFTAPWLYAEYALSKLWPPVA